MPKIRHIALTTNDPKSTAEFFMRAFDMSAVEIREDNAWAILSDGYINMTLLKFQVDRYGGGRPGLHHFGFHVEDLDQAEAKLGSLDAVELAEWNQTYGNVEGTPDKWVGERKWKTPDGVTIDVNATGWRMRPGGERGE